MDEWMKNYSVSKMGNLEQTVASLSTLRLCCCFFGLTGMQGCLTIERL